MELLAPAGNYEKLITAVHFGADAVYFAGKKMGLRAFAGNFAHEEIFKEMKYLHSHGKIQKIIQKIEKCAENIDKSPKDSAEILEKIFQEIIHGQTSFSRREGILPP